MNQEQSPTDIHEGEVHHYENASVAVSDGSPWYESRSYKGFMAFVALIRWVIVAVVFAFGVYLYQRDINAQSVVSVADTAREIKAVRDVMEDRKRQMDAQFIELKSSTVTTPVFNAQFEALNKRLDRIEASLDRVNGRP